jgi:hypothetical protein
VEDHSSTCFPKSEVASWYEMLMHEKGHELHLRDEYRNLMVHLMIGCVYQDDKLFRDSILFESSDIQTWVYLKLASCHEEGL